MKSKIMTVGMTAILASSNMAMGSIRESLDQHIVDYYEELKEDELLKQAKLDIARVWSVSFNTKDVTEPSYLTVKELEQVLSGTNMKHLAKDIIEAENTYGINAFILSSIIALESGWNTSDRAKLNNLTGYAVYSDSDRGATFSSPYECIMATSKLLKYEYIYEKGKYYTGENIDNIGKLYSSDKQWSHKVSTIANKLYEKYNELFRQQY